MAEINRTILLVDDETNIQVLIKDALSAETRSVLVAGTLAEAGAALEREKVDLIILDRMLPDGDGLDFCAKLREDSSRDAIPILLFSARTEDADKLRAIGCGADGYIEKPCDLSELETRVAALLAAGA